MIRIGIGLLISSVILYASSMIISALKAPLGLLLVVLFWLGISLFCIGIVVLIAGILKKQNDRAIFIRGCFASISFGGAMLLVFIALYLSLSELIDASTATGLLVASGILLATIFLPIFWKPKRTKNMNQKGTQEKHGTSQ